MGSLYFFPSSPCTSITRFGLNCKKIKNQAHVNEFVSDEVMLKRKSKEIQQLKERLEEMEKQKNADVGQQVHL